MTFQKLLFIFFIAEFVKNGLFFNPMLTYSLRFHKMIFIPNITGNYTIDQYRDKQFFNGVHKVDTNVPVNKAVIVFNRCNPEGVNCEYFQSWTMTNICQLLKEKNQIWSRWYSSYIPPMECPVDKVYYKLVNATIDSSIALALYPEVTDYRWKVTQNVYSDDTFVGGYIFEASFFGYRKRTKSIIKN